MDNEKIKFDREVVERDTSQKYSTVRAVAKKLCEIARKHPGAQAVTSIYDWTDVRLFRVIKLSFLTPQTNKHIHTYPFLNFKKMIILHKI